MRLVPYPVTQKIVLRGSVPKLKSGFRVNEPVMLACFMNSQVGVEYLGLKVTVHLTFLSLGGDDFTFLFDLLPSLHPETVLIESLSE
jgi:hypothetical protein